MAFKAPGWPLQASSVILSRTIPTTSLSKPLRVSICSSLKTLSCCAKKVANEFLVLLALSKCSGVSLDDLSASLLDC